jgi:hypothetical protein
MPPTWRRQAANPSGARGVVGRLRPIQVPHGQSQGLGDPEPTAPQEPAQGPVPDRRGSGAEGPQ